jgi:hypothetical protein
MPTTQTTFNHLLLSGFVEIVTENNISPFIDSIVPCYNLVMKSKDELELFEKLEKERKESDRLYAIKLVERIVFALVALLCVGVIGALIKLVLLQ